MSRPRALILMLEFSSWSVAKPLSYTASYAYEDGLRSKGFDCTVLPCFADLNPNYADLWYQTVQKQFDGERYDQVWIWLIHLNPPQHFMEWLASIAPIRVGVLIESLTYSDEDKSIHDHFNTRWPILRSQIPYLTHILTADEADENLIIDSTGCPAKWTPTSIPARFLDTEEETYPRKGPPAFLGTLYEKRAALLSHPSLAGLVSLPKEAESATSIPERFDEISRSLLRDIFSQSAHSARLLPKHYDALRMVREESFLVLLKEFRSWIGILNLPSYFRGLTGRVFEAIAVGTPVITWVIPDRPRANSLFANGIEILQFDPTSPADLRQKLRRLSDDYDYAVAIASRAREKLISNHSSEIRTQETLLWISSSMKESELSNISKADQDKKNEPAFSSRPFRQSALGIL